ncbi:hypothetical protein WR25_19262 [Diploscapter pachys]|uniref:Uncharacterized protein n=1 Tax=Diploscapter pachys TaxID=2018661 RepID=A0A2A2L7N6_9BILA|nr:hypothetical protein WR25_19262 [Diploscapter pachys]
MSPFPCTSNFLLLLVSCCFFSFCTTSEPSSSAKDSQFCYGDGILHKNSPCRFFAIVFDAGSTGTRLHLYRYIHNVNPNGLPFIVEEEIFQEASPGLSSHSSNPKEAARSLKPLLNTARSVIPHYMWQKTPITLKATAGLRLLPGDLAEDILEAIEEEIFASGFFAVPNAVSVMSGSDEGIYSWFTLNLLLETLYTKDPQKISSPHPSKSVAAFDLGGGSTQLTFWPETNEIFEAYPGFERDIDFFGTHIRLFTHSFLGNGLIAARLNVLLESTHDIYEEEQKLTTHCLPRDYHIHEWEYSLKMWTINGTELYSFAACYDSVKVFVEQSEIMKLKDLNGKLIYLFSYFFDRALNAGLVKDNNGGTIRLEQFKLAAEKACKRKSSELEGPHWLPWQCLDLTYIYSLLKDGYGFDDGQQLVLAKKIKGMEVAWAQGLSYGLINEFNEFEASVHGTEKPGTNNQTNNSTFVGNIMGYIYTGTTNVLSFFNLIS